MSSYERIAFLGTGLMGEPMAARLLAAGRALTLWNRTPEKTGALASRGAQVASSAAEAVRHADVVIAMLADAAAVTAVLFQEAVTDALRAGAIVIDMSSIPPTEAQAHAQRLERRGVAHLDAPVSGGTAGARAGTLAIMVGGDPQQFESMRALLELLGRPTWVGPHGAGQLAKLANQTIVAITIGAVAEALLLASSGGADPDKVRSALTGGFADSAILTLHGQRMLDRAWAPGGTMRTQLKDLKTILAVARELKLELPLCECVAALFESGVSAGFAGYDHSALLLELERHNTPARVGSGPDQPPP